MGKCCENLGNRCRLNHDMLDGVLQVNLFRMYDFEKVLKIIEPYITKMEFEIMEDYNSQEFCYYEIAYEMIERISAKTKLNSKIDLMTHLVDVFYWFYGEPHKINNKLRLKFIEKDDINSIIDNFNKENKLKITERQVLTNQRIGQEVFKKRLNKVYHKCMLCDINDKKYLIASHIKPWIKADNNERLDFYNGFLLCPNHDAAFDKLDISFDNRGQLLISNDLSEKVRELLNLNENVKIELFEGNKKYLKWHREKFIKKTRILK